MGTAAHVVAVINTPLFVTVVNVMAEWLVLSCNTPPPPLSDLRFHEPLQLSSVLSCVSLAFTELRWIYGLINAHSPGLSSSIGPYAQPLNLKGGQLSGPYVAACPVSQYWVKPVPKSVYIYFRSSLACIFIMSPFFGVMEDLCAVSCQIVTNLVVLYKKQYLAANQTLVRRMTHWFPVKCHVKTEEDKFVGGQTSQPPCV